MGDPASSGEEQKLLRAPEVRHEEQVVDYSEKQLFFNEPNSSGISSSISEESSGKGSNRSESIDEPKVVLAEVLEQGQKSGRKSPKKLNKIKTAKSGKPRENPLDFDSPSSKPKSPQKSKTESLSPVKSPKKLNRNNQSGGSFLEDFDFDPPVSPRKVNPPLSIRRNKRPKDLNLDPLRSPEKSLKSPIKSPKKSPINYFLKSPNKLSKINGPKSPSKSLKSSQVSPIQEEENQIEFAGPPSTIKTPKEHQEFIFELTKSDSPKKASTLPRKSAAKQSDKVRLPRVPSESSISESSGGVSSSNRKMKYSPSKKAWTASDSPTKLANMLPSIRQTVRGRK